MRPITLLTAQLRWEASAIKLLGIVAKRAADATREFSNTLRKFKARYNHRPVQRLDKRRRHVRT